MKTNLHNNSRGIAHFMAIILVIVVLAVSGAGYYVYNKGKSNPNLTGKTPAEKTAIKETETACSKAYNDKDFCKFASSYTTKGPYKMTIVTSDNTDRASTTITEIDAKDNTSTITQFNTKETSAVIKLNGDTYIKNEADGSWCTVPETYTKNGEIDEWCQQLLMIKPLMATKFSPSFDQFVKIELSKPVDQRTAIKKLGNEKCGTLTCIKYSFVYPTEKTITNGIIWIGDKDFQLYKMSYKDDDGTFVTEFTYSAVTISVPSPIKKRAAPPDADGIIIGPNILPEVRPQ